MSTNLTKFGSKTPKSAIHKSESQKLHQSFEVKASEEILSGSPVQIEADGTISNYLGTGIYIGIAITDSKDSAYTAGQVKEVTVMVTGYAIVYGISAAAAGTGYVKPTEKPTNGSAYTKYAVAADADPKNFIALNKTTGIDEVVMILVK